MTLHINDSGTWRDITNVYVNDSGTWRELQEIHVNDSGTWRLVYQLLSVQLIDDAYSYAQNTASMTFGSDGSFSATDGGAEAEVYDWLLGGNAANVDVRVTPTSGFFSTGTTGTWLNLGTSRNFTRQWSGGLAVNTVQSTVELRNANTAVVLATATITLSATP